MKKLGFVVLGIAVVGVAPRVVSAEERCVIAWWDGSQICDEVPDGYNPGAPDPTPQTVDVQPTNEGAVATITGIDSDNNTVVVAFAGGAPPSGGTPPSGGAPSGTPPPGGTGTGLNNTKVQEILRSHPVTSRLMFK